jgi:pyruvate dehydrogenase E2 component (dihydrolipoamide acetyltransferase)
VAVDKIQVPDIGDEQDVEVIEILVAAGDEIRENDSLIVLESDKAAMEIPSPKSGVVKEVLVKVGDQVSKGAEIVSLETDIADGAPAEPEKSAKAEPAMKAELAGQSIAAPQSVAAPQPTAAPEPAAGGSKIIEVKVPDLGGDSDVDVIEILVAVGDIIQKESGLITLESDKAAMDVPSPVAGVVKSIKVKVGDKVSEGSAIFDVETTESTPVPAPVEEKPAAAAPAPAASPAEKLAAPAAAPASVGYGDTVYAGPAVRKMARELGVDLNRVSGSGSRGRIVKEDIDAYVKGILQGGAQAGAVGTGVPGIEDIDFRLFGEIEEVEMTKLHRVTAQNMSRNWLNVPHVTQFDEADVTELEEFREEQKALAEKKGVKLTPLPFIVKACARALQEHPQFNVSLHSSGTKLIQKKYVHIGVAVATPAGLMVPVVKDVDRKTIWEIAAEIADLGAKAKERKLTKDDMQGACFTVSSLGNLGGMGFTPIVNAPEVAILGVSKTTVKPMYMNNAFVPRKMLPFALSYDHRAVNGVDGGLFCSTLATLLNDIRLLAL